jgi:hypothetical protein
MAVQQQSSPFVSPGGLRIAAWASSSLYVIALVIWAASSWRAARGTSSAFAADLTGLALWGSLLAVFVAFRRSYPRRKVILAQLVLAVATLFSATQVVFDVIRRR